MRCAIENSGFIINQLQLGCKHRYRRPMRSLSLAILLLTFQNTAFANIKVKVHFSDIANLVYQLDCVSESLPHCSRSTYNELWKKNFLKDNADEALVKSWLDLINRYDLSAELNTSELKEKPGRYDKIQFFNKIRIASFQSSTMDDYFSRLDVITIPRDKEKFEKIIRHFYPRFKIWWQKVAQPKGQKFANDAEALLKRSDISNRIKQFSQFYEVNFPNGYIVHFNLFYRPDSEESTSGEQVENYSVAEFLPIEKPVDRIDVIIHELCHFFFNSHDKEKFKNFKNYFDENENVSAQAAYNLINEGMATALGNGIINKTTMNKKRWEKYSTKPLSFYNNYHIDTTAKSVLPWLEQWLQDGKTLYTKGFYEKYMLTLEDSLGNELSSPKLLLNKLVLVADNKFDGKFRDVVGRIFKTSTMYAGQGEWSDERTLEDYFNNPKLAALIIIHLSNVNQLKDRKVLSGKDYDQLKKAVKKDENIIFSFKRNLNTQAYVIVATKYEDALVLLNKLASLKQGFNGQLAE